MIKILLWLLILFCTTPVQAKVIALFHPKDPTFEQIADWIIEAQNSIDIAMYNLDVSDSSPILKAFQSPEVQHRLRSGNLQARIVFEGYSSKEDNARKMQVLEDLGLDARYLGKVVKVHHKFIVIDSELPGQRVATGSANWSMTSYRNYNENILFFEDESEVSARFQQEFNRIWSNSKEFGHTVASRSIRIPQYSDQNNIEIFFNSPKTLERNSPEPTRLTDQIVRLIQNAKNEIQIASTRVRLLPILESLVAAAERGVKVKILISQDDYIDIGRRAEYLLVPKNIEVRVKIYNLQVKDYLAFQMHNKFMLVDGQTLWTGSFNWSESSENRYIENGIEISSPLNHQVIQSYQQEFQDLWDLGRENLPKILDRLAHAPETPCSLIPMSLQVSEARKLVRLGRKCKP